MHIQVTLDLPSETYERAVNLAQLTSRNVEEIFADALILSLPPLRPVENALSINTLSDDEILRLAQSQMDTKEGARFSMLQDKQQAGLLNEVERVELANLLQVYQAGLLRKALALHEAVRRGLHPLL